MNAQAPVNTSTANPQVSGLGSRQPGFNLSPPPSARAPMSVKKRSGAHESIDVNKIVRAVTRCCEGIADVDPMRVALKTIAGLYDGATTRELDELSIRTASSFVAEEPAYSRVAARLLAAFIDKEVQGLGIYSFSQSIRTGFDVGVVNGRVLEFVEANARKLNDAIDTSHTQRFEYFGIRTLYDRYLLKHPTKRHVLETPPYFWMRVAVALSTSVHEAIEQYQLFASLDYLPSSPTLFNSGTLHEQLSSCFLLDSPPDSLEGVYEKYKDIALLSKFSGGIGVAWHRVRSEGSLIRSTNGLSNGIVPWLKTLDSSVAAVNQGGKRKGAACVYLETWHADIEAFLELRDKHLSNLCTEIVEVTTSSETAVCNLGSINLARHVGSEGFDFDKLAHTVELAVRQLDRVIDLNFYPIATARTSNLRWRPVGLGLMGLQDVFFKLRLPFDSAQARALSRRISEEVYFHALRASVNLAREHGAHPSFSETRAAVGELQFDAWDVTPSDSLPWRELIAQIHAHGLRNSLLIAIAPTATIASIAGCYECIEPQVSNLFKRETLSGDFLQVNLHLVEELKALGLWTPETRDAIKLADGSIQGVDSIPVELKSVFRTAWELPMKALIEMAAERGAFIDQSQSLNLFIANPNIGPLSSMYMYAWKQGLKTTYYLRSRPATNIAKATVREERSSTSSQMTNAVACSLENPEQCEACQ
jgi:ribonucleotide reductase alpha subunit